MSIAPAFLMILLPVAFAACAVSAQTPDASSKPDYWVYISGTPKEKPSGIHLYRMNITTGEVTSINTLLEAPDPNFLAVSNDNKTIYASTNPVDPQTHKVSGAVSAFAIDAITGQLRLLNSQPSHGMRAVHVSLDPANKTALVANYQGNTVAALGINADGSLMPATPDGIQTHTGSGPNTTRQQHPYLHSIYPDPTGKFAYACDLGTDQIHIYALDTEKHALTTEGQVTAPPGSGPRHFTFSPDGKHAYLVTEMGSTIIAYRFDAASGSLTQTQIVPSIPPTVTENLDKQTGSEIHIHPNGKFLYVSNRGPHSSIALFAVNPTNGTLTFADDISSGGQNPRYFGIDPTGNFLLVGNQNSDNVVIFRIDSQTGKLTATGQTLSIGAPMCVAFVPVGK